MRQLFLASSFAKSYQKAAALIDFSTIKKIGMISNAADPFDDPWWVERDRDAFLSLGCDLIEIDLRIYDRDGDDLQSTLDPVDALFVGGGHVLYLLDLIEKSGLNQLLPDFVEQKPYIATSAGSIVVGPEIVVEVYKKDIDMDGERSDVVRKALGLVDFVMLPHRGSEDHRDSCLQRIPLLYDHGKPYVCLGDEYAVWVEADSFSIV